MKISENIKDIIDYAVALLLIFVLVVYFFDIPLPWSRQEADPESRAPEALQNSSVPGMQSKRMTWDLPASYEDIAKAFVSVCADKKYPGGSGFLVGIEKDGDRRIMLFTARHVAKESIKRSGTNTVTLLVHRPAEKADFRKTYEGPSVNWMFPFSKGDLACIDVTQTFKTMREEGIDIRYLPFRIFPEKDDAHPEAVKGVLFIQKANFEAFKIGLGSEVRILGSSSELWGMFKGPLRRRQPLALRHGIIASPRDAFSDPDINPRGVFMIDAEVHPGFSGGPVFTPVKVGTLEYPAMIGLVRSVLVPTPLSPDANPRDLVQPSNLALITPIDEWTKLP